GAAVRLGSSTYSVAMTASGATESGTTVTITTASQHNLSVGQTVVISGVGVSGYNGTFTVLSVPSTTTFTYAAATSGLAASGAGTVSSAYGSWHNHGTLSLGAAATIA